MKYTIGGFSQAKALSLGLDITDCFILGWFTDFAASGHMVKIIHDKKVFYRVKYDGIIRELPIAGISSVKGIARRFEKYVDKGLLIRLCQKIQGNGTKVYYAPTTLIASLQYDDADENPTENDSDGSGDDENPGEQTDGSNNDGESSDSPTDTPVAVDSCRQDVQAPSDGHADSRLTDTPVAVNIDSPTTIQVPDSTTSREQQETQIKKYLEKYFDADSFSDDLYGKIITAVNGNLSESELQGYLDWMFAKCTGKNDRAAFFYKLATQKYSVAQYINCKVNEAAERDEAKKILKSVCPVCGNEHATSEDCPVCGLNWDWINHGLQEKIDWWKKVYAIPADKKKVIDEELEALSGSYASAMERIRHQAEYDRKREEIYRKYTG